MRNSSFAQLIAAAACVLPGTTFGALAVIGNMTHVYDSHAGDKHVGAVTVMNTSTKPMTAKIYVSDYLFESGGKVFFKPPSNRERCNAPWMKLAFNRIELPPNAKEEIAYEINVPKDPNLSGSYWSTILIEPEPEVEKNTKGVGITPVFRSAVQVINRIGNGQAALDAIAHGFKPVVDGKGQPVMKNNQEVLDPRRFFVGIKNTGTKDLSTEVSVEVTNAQGDTVYSRTGNRTRLYPTTSSDFFFDLSSVNPGNYHVFVMMDAGGDDMFGAHYNVQVPAAVK